MSFDKSISEPQAEKLLREHEKKIGKILSRKEASKLAYHLLYLTHNIE